MKYLLLFINYFLSFMSNSSNKGK